MLMLVSNQQFFYNRYFDEFIDIGKNVFNDLFRNSGDYPIIRRQCRSTGNYSCSSHLQVIYYKRLRNKDTFDAYGNMKELWSSSDNILGTDFNLYSTLSDALSDTNAWTFCNYDDTTLNIAAFRDCGPSQSNGGQWTVDVFTFPADQSLYSIKEVLFSIYTPRNGTYDYYNNMKVWTSPNNILGTDYNLYSTLNDAKENKNAWTWCDYDDIRYGIGAFRNCGPSGVSGCQITGDKDASGWSQYNCANTVYGMHETKFSIYATDADCTKIVSTSGVWDIASCTNSYYPFLCNYPPTSSPTVDPTPTPTDTPTNNPTPAPTDTPSKNPTKAPSPAPTDAPSNPTTIPTQSPSMDPTSDPTRDPTQDPTYNPTTATNDPSNSPTMSPSMAPSIAPTTPPTTCYDLNGFNTNDGYEQDINQQISDLMFDNPVLDNGKAIDTVAQGQFRDMRIEFINDMKQQLNCSSFGSCVRSNIIFRNNTICNIICQEFLSCYLAEININQCEQTEIICNGGICLCSFNSHL